MRCRCAASVCLCVGLALGVCAISASGQPKEAQTKTGGTETAGPVSTAAEFFSATKAKAETGDPKAQVRLGWLYEWGIGAPRSVDDAFRWYSGAADQGLPIAQYNLGYYHATGQGTLQDFAKSLTWYGKAIDHNHPEAMLERGWLSARGLGVTNSFADAVDWWKRAADSGYAVARQELGLEFLVATNHYGVCAETVLLPKRTPVGEAAFDAFRRARRELEFERISFTTPGGKNLENAAVLLVSPIAIYYRQADGGRYGEAKFANLPVDIQQRFGYGANRAAAYEAAQKAAAEARRREEVKRQQQSVIRFGEGTGFFITEDGYLLTSCHVVMGASRVQVVSGDYAPLDAKVVAFDADADVALLKVTGVFPALPLIDSAGVLKGAHVFTVGYPLSDVIGHEAKLTDGTISSISGLEFQMSVPVQHGNSGGPLVDARGNVIGIVKKTATTMAVASMSQGTLPQSIHFALKSDYALRLVKTKPEAFAGLKQEKTAPGRELSDVNREVEPAVALISVYR